MIYHLLPVVGLVCIDYALVERLYFAGGIRRKEERIEDLGLWGVQNEQCYLPALLSDQTVRRGRYM